MDGLSYTGYTQRELEAVKTALTCILQQENPLPAEIHAAREAEISKRIYGGLELSKSSSDSSPNESQLDSLDINLISRLLKQVNHLLTDSTGDGTRLSVSENAHMSKGCHDFPVENKISHSPHVLTEETVVEAALGMANAAKEVAKAAAFSAENNAKIMEMCMGKSGHQGKTSETSEDGSDKDEDVVKKVERQNTITHVILGAMVIGTIVWRLKLVSMFRGVQKTLTNPLQTLFKPGKEEVTKNPNVFQKALPRLLAGGDKDDESHERNGGFHLSTI